MRIGFTVTVLVLAAWVLGFVTAERFITERDLSQRIELSQQIDAVEQQAAQIQEVADRARWLSGCDVRLIYPSVPDSVVITAVCPKPAVEIAGTKPLALIR